LGNAQHLGETILHTKGVVLDSLIEDRVVARESADPKQRGILEEIRATKQGLVDVSLQSPQRTNSSGSRQGKFKEFSDRLDMLESSLARQVSALGRSRRALGVTIPQVQGTLAGDQVLIEVVRYVHYPGKEEREKRYGVVVIASTGEPKWITLGAAAVIEQDVELYRNSVREKTDEATMHSVLRTLHDRVWAPIEKTLPAGIKTVILSPDGELNFVSFATLLDPDNQFLVQKYLIRYVSSGRDLLNAVPKPADTRFVFFGNPDFQAKLQIPAAQPDAPSPTAMREVERGELGRLVFRSLPGTERECTLLDEWARNEGYQTELRLGTTATERTLAAVESPRVLHLATHGFFLPKPPRTDEPPMFGSTLDALRPVGRLSNPMYRSGLVLAGAQRTIEAWARGETPPPESDGILTAEEVSGLHLDGTWLVTLSACETGVGKARSGEGVLGLRRAFVQAGAQNLLMTLWPISDDTTVQIIQDFYTAAFATADPGRGLAEVQRAWLEKLRKEKGLLFAVNRAGPFIVSSLGPTPHAAAPPAAAAKRRK
jgi:CHAT domain-containing protein